jgi:predicted O-methyltransferase YrrM
MTIEQIILENNLNGFHLDGGTDKNTEHSYCNFYENLLSTKKNLELDVLEIGTYKGGFAFTLYEYLKYSKITSIDISDSFSNILRNKMKDRFNLILSDAYKLETLDVLEDKFDIVIDDGPHDLNSQIFCIEHYVNKLKSDGILIIEDIASDAYLQILIDKLDKNHFKYEVIDLRKNKNRFDDLILTISCI